MADITHVFKATLKTIQTRNKALGRINREGSLGPNNGKDAAKDGGTSSPSLSSSPSAVDPLNAFFSSLGGSNNGKNAAGIARTGAKSEFNARAKEIIVKITKLRDFLLRHRMDYINIHSHLIFEQGGGNGRSVVFYNFVVLFWLVCFVKITVFLSSPKVRSMTDAERDQVDGNAQAVMRTCGEEIRHFRADLARSKLPQQVHEHRSITISMIDSYLKVVCKIFSDMKGKIFLLAFVHMASLANTFQFFS